MNGRNERSQAQGPGVRLAAKLLLAGTTTIICLIVAEAVIRIAAPQPPSWLDIYQRHPVLPTFCLQPNLDRLTDTGETRWYCITDDKGFRVSRGYAEDDDRPIVLCLGDSFAFGHGVDHRESFVGLLDDDEELPYHFINAGVSGYGPVQYQQVFDFQLNRGMHPAQVIVVVFLGNDFPDCVFNKDKSVVDGIIGNRTKSFKTLLKRNSHLYRLISSVYHRTQDEPMSAFGLERTMIDPAAWAGPKLTRARRIFQASFQAIANACRQRKITLHVVLIPMRVTLLEHTNQSPTDPNYLLPNTHAHDILRALGIQVLDLTEQYAEHPYKEMFFAHDRHLTPSGNRLTADAIKQRVLDSVASTPLVRDDGSPVLDQP